MEAFASIEDLEASWRELTDAEKPRAERLLMQASMKIRGLFARRRSLVIDPFDEVQAYNLMATCAAMVQRAMSVDEDLMGVKQYTQMAGSYSGSYTYENSSGNLYLEKSEKQALGLTAQTATNVRGAIHGGGGCGRDDPR